MSDNEHKYTNGETTVIWKPDVCIHSGICARGLHAVFIPKARPWVNMAAASTERIAGQVKKCHSGALSFVRSEQGNP